MPTYDYACSHCEECFEKKLHIVDYKLPETQPCPICFTENSVHIFLSAAPPIGDPIRLGITRPPDAWTHGILDRMQHTVPNGGIIRDSSGKIQLDTMGKPRYQMADFSKCRYSPGRLI